MASLRDLKLSYWAYMKAYRYRSHEWRPGARLTKPLEQARVAVVTTAALYGQGAGDTESGAYTLDGADLGELLAAWGPCPA